MGFVSRVSALEMGGLPGLTAVLDNGLVLSTDWSTRTKPFYFHTTNLDGMEASAFGAVPRNIQEATRNRPVRRIAYAGSDEFVAGPPAGVSGSYSIELWSVQGRLIRTFRRDVAWFPAMEEGRPRGPGNRPYPSFRILHVDSAGVLLVAVAVPNGAWRSSSNSESGRSMPNTKEMEDVWLEAIDIRSGTLLSSTKIRGIYAEDSLPRLIPRSNLLARKHESATDVFVEILRYDFVRQSP
jgi:hypothetical protein